MVNDELIRASIYSLLNGNIVYDGVTIPVADGFMVSQDFKVNHLIIGNIFGVENNTFETFIDNVTVTLDAVTYQFNGWNRTAAASIEEQAVNILIPNIKQSTLTANGLQFNSVRRENWRYLEDVSENGNVVRKISNIEMIVVKK